MPEPINLKVTATDEASKTFDQVKAKGDALAKEKVTVDVTAVDEAGAILDEDIAKVEALDATPAEVNVVAIDEAGPILDADLAKAEALDATPVVVSTTVEGTAEVVALTTAITETDAAAASAATALETLATAETQVGTAATTATSGVTALGASEGQTLGATATLTTATETMALAMAQLGFNTEAAAAIFAAAWVKALDDGATMMEADVVATEAEIAAKTAYSEVVGVATAATQAETAALAENAATAGAAGGSGGFGGLIGSIKGFSSSITEAFGALAPSGALLGGFTLVAAKTVNTFKDLALQVQAFSVATGESLADSSRLVVVSEDLGVSFETLQGAVGKMNKNIGAGKVDLQGMGVTAQDTSGRLVQILQYIERIPDETTQATVAAQIFGRSWQSLAPLLANVNDIQQRMAEVPKPEIVTDEDVARSRALQDATKELGHDWQVIELTAGRAFVPIATGLANMLDKVNKIGDKLNAGGWASFVDKILFWSPPLQAFNDNLNGTNDITAKTIDNFRQVGDVVDLHGRKMLYLSDREVDVTNATQGHIDELVKEDQALTAAKGSADDFTTSLQNNIASLKEQKTAADAVTKSLQDQSDAMLALGDDTFAANKAGRDLQQAQADLPGKIKEIQKQVAQGKISQATGAREIAQAQDDLAQSAERNASAQAKQAEDTARANGQTVTAKDHLDNLNASLLTSAANLSGPAKQALINYIAQINGIPPEAVTDILANTDPKNLAEQQAKIDEVSRARTVDITAQLITSTATQQYGAWVAQIAANPPIIKPQINLPFGSAGPGIMGGGPVNESGVYNVGEAGPERVFLPRGANVMTAGQVMTADAGGGSGGVTHVINLNVRVDPTVNLAQAGRSIADALEAYYRSSGSRRAYAAA